MDQAEFKKIEISLPNKPGIYKYFDEQNKLLYVGKAKNLRKRVSSYFFKNRHDSNRIRLLVRKTNRIEFTIVETEQDALLLENSLIKKHQPWYNIQLKDGKTYPFIRIKNERFPRIFITRKLIKDGSIYLGPYTSVNRVRVILEFIKNLYPIRTCNYNLSKKNIANSKFKVCLEYHLGNCKAPCTGEIFEEEYNENIKQIKNILKGNFGPVKSYLKHKLKQHADLFEFELANEMKEKLEIIKQYQSKSTIVSHTIDKVDVFSISDSEDFAYINFLQVELGTIVKTHTIEIVKKLNESKADLLMFAINDLRLRYHSDSNEIILPFYLNYPDEKILITVPQRGDKKKLLELSLQNALYFKSEKINAQARKREKQNSRDILKIIQEDFRLPDLPAHIECFDNSNIQGSNPVASVVVFRDGKPFKSDYRHFNIKTVEGPDDFASMYEVVFRRYRRMLDEGVTLPNLIVIDGGKGQLNAALKALVELEIRKNVTLCSIAKKLEEIYFPNDPVPLHISKKSPSLKVIQHLRNEAHRFAINFHRNKRSGAALQSELTAINGIGEKTIKKLLKRFKSVRKVKATTFRELATEIGTAKARSLRDYFDGK